MPKKTLRELGAALAPAPAPLPWPIRWLARSWSARRAEAAAKSAALFHLRMEALSLLEPLGMLLDDGDPHRALRALSEIPLELELSEQARVLCRFALGAAELPRPDAAESEDWLPEDMRLAWGRICADLRDGLPLSAPDGPWLPITDSLNSLRSLELADWPSKIWGAAIERESIELALEWPGSSGSSAKPRRSRGL